MLIQWFPGHMAKAKRILQENLKIVDIVLELRDARIPESSSNPDLDKLVEHKSRIIILNKRDLANPQITRQWVEHFSKKAPTFAINTISGEGLNDVMNAVRQKADAINERLKTRGRNPRNIRLLVIGIPNVGKSALINRIANRSSAKVSNRPGVTRGPQWIKVREGVQLMDSPGILWPKFEDQLTGLRLAVTGAIKSELLNEEEITYHLIKWLQEIAPEELKSFFKVELSDNPYETILAIGRKRGLLQAGGVVRGEQTAKMILKEFRDGRIGKISLESPRAEEEVTTPDAATGMIGNGDTGDNAAGLADGITAGAGGLGMAGEFYDANLDGNDVAPTEDINGNDDSGIYGDNNDEGEFASELTTEELSDRAHTAVDDRTRNVPESAVDDITYCS